MSKEKKLLTALKDFRRTFPKEHKLTFQDVLEFNRVHNPELYQEYMRAVAELEKTVDKPKKK